MLTPAGGAGEHGLVFFAGAKVEPEAYAATFRETAAQGRTVVIVQSFLNLPLLETRPLSEFTDLAPEVDAWAVGGHSMGGVQACRVADAEPEAVHALVLFASYCADDALAQREDQPLRRPRVHGRGVRHGQRNRGGDGRPFDRRSTAGNLSTRHLGDHRRAGAPWREIRHPLRT